MILYGKKTPAGTLWQFVAPIDSRLWALCYVPLSNTDLVSSLDLLAAIGSQMHRSTIKSYHKIITTYVADKNLHKTHNITITLRSEFTMNPRSVTPLHRLVLVGRQQGFSVLELSEEVATQLFTGGGCVRVGEVEQAKVNVTLTGARVLGTYGFSPESTVEIVYDVRTDLRELDFIASGFAGFFVDTWLHVSRALTT